MADPDDADATNGAEGPEAAADADSDRLTGLPVEEATEVVSERHPDHDPEQVQATLESVAEDGVVTEDGVQAALGHVSKVVATPATRAEFAALDLDDARETAADVSEVDVVAARLSEFEARLDAIESEVEALDETLQSLVSRAKTDPVYQVALDVSRLRTEANQLQGMADELAMEVEEFERWVSNPELRYDDLSADATDLQEAVDQLAADVDTFETGDARNDDDDATGPSDDDRGAAWFDLRCRQHVLSLLLRDLRAEAADVRTVADRRDASVDEHHDELVDELNTVESRLQRLDDRLAKLATDEWASRFGERLDAVAAELRAFEPPVDWHEVQTTMEAYREG